MGRPATNREAKKAEIVKAALECFATYGYEGSSNKVIARTAGLKSAALIYHYFPSKASLFQACLESISLIDDLQHTLEENQDDVPDVYLPRVTRAYLATLREEPIAQLVPMVFITAQSHPELLHMVLDRVQKGVLLPLRAYFQRQVILGNIRSILPDAAIQQFFGPVVFRAIATLLAPKSLPILALTDEQFILNLVQTFLDGVRVRNPLNPQGESSEMDPPSGV